MQYTTIDQLLISLLFLTLDIIRVAFFKLESEADSLSAWYLPKTTITMEKARDQSESRFRNKEQGSVIYLDEMP